MGPNLKDINTFKRPKKIYFTTEMLKDGFMRDEFDKMMKLTGQKRGGEEIEHLDRKDIE